MPCLDDPTLAALVDGKLAPAARSSAEAHLDGCPVCLEVVATIVRSRPRAAGSGAGDVEAAAPPEAGSAPRYLLGSEVARGGMGRIVSAEDRVLGRRVALKLLRAPASGMEERFRREIAITARLQHPAIVPVYDAGTLPDGQPFYAMRLVSGKSLDQAAAGTRALDERLALLPAVMVVVDAVAYAHGEGVVHRDLKPQNVLVGPFGETVVLDWGLAKTLGVDDPAATQAGPLAPPSPGATQDGEILGTLAYMAPEQAAGEAADERADVYGLGAILYHVLAGAPPHAGRSTSLRTEAIRERPEPLVARVPGVPADLAAIVDRAMAADAAKRYPSARELAEDLRRFLSGQLVRAHDYSPLQLVRRFASRHRAAVAVASAAVALIVALVATGMSRIVAARDRAETERVRAEAERARAETERAQSDTQRDAAEALVGFVLGDLRARLERVGRLDVLGGVGREVTAYYERTRPRAGGVGAEDLLRRASAFVLAGEVATAAGDLAEAERAFRASLAAAEDAEAHEGGDRAADARCRAHLSIASVRTTQGDLAGAEVDAAKCAGLAAARLGGAGPTVASWKRMAADAAMTRGESAAFAGDPILARKLYGDAHALASSLGDGDDDAVRLAIKAKFLLGQLLTLQGELEQAAAETELALDGARRFAERHPDDADAERTVGAILFQRGNIAESSGDLAAAERAHLQGREIATELIARDPSNTTWLGDLENVEHALGSIAASRDDVDGALEHLRASLAIARQRSRRDPRNVEWLRNVGVSEFMIGKVLRDQERLREARESLEAAVATFERVHTMTGGSADGEYLLGVALVGLGELTGAGGDQAGARRLLDRALELRRRAFAREDVPNRRREIAETLAFLAATDRRERRVDDARRRLEEARALLAPLRANAAADADLAITLGEVDREWAAVGGDKAAKPR